MTKFRGAVQQTARYLVCIGLTGLISVAAQAQTANEPWKWEAAVYGWFPGLSGSTSFPTGASGPSIDVSADQLIDAMKFAFMGQIQGRKGKWGIWSDLVYSDLGGSQQSSRDFTVGGQQVGVDADLSFDAKMWVWSLAGFYNLDARPESTVDLLFGTRLLDQEQTLDWTLSSTTAQLPGRSGSSTISSSYWDAIVGIKGRHSFGESGRWFLPYYLDVGGGQSKLTWQINAGVGYRFDWGAVGVTWRYLDYQFKSGEPIDSMSMNGPVVGVAFRW